MVIQPQSLETNRTAIIDRLKNRVPGLTNFEENTVNWVIADAYAQEWRDFQHIALATQLGGWVDYAGGPVDDDQLVDLNLDTDPINIDLLNDLLADEDLEALAAQNGISRNEGVAATGTVVFGTVDDTTTIDAGTVVSTEQVELTDGSFDRVEFVTTETVTTDPGTTTVEAAIECTVVGEVGNVGAGKITLLPNNPSGVEGVTNPDPTTGGEGPETNDELRQRVRNATTETSGGGTKDGLAGAVVEELDIEADDVNVLEFPDTIDDATLSSKLPNTTVDELSNVSGQSDGDAVIVTGDGSDLDGIYLWDNDNTEWLGPFVRASYNDVVVDGGTDAEANDAIDAAKPAGVGANLVRPTEATTDVTVDVVAEEDADDIDTARVKEAIQDYLADLGIGEPLYRDQLIELIMDADEDGINLSTLTVTVNSSTVSEDYATGDKEVIRAGTISVTSSVA